MSSSQVPTSSALEIRDAFFEEVRRLVAINPHYVVLTVDQGAHALDLIRKEAPSQYYNCGIAEQNIAAVAAGLALEGFHPVICGISNFVSLRCCEQISVNFSAMRLPVTIVASGGGLTYSSDGPTHHGIQDIAVMCSMPHFSVLNPSDAVSTQGLARWALAQATPVYCRIEKGFLPEIHSGETDWSSGAALLNQGKERVAVVSTGYMSQIARQAVAQLKSSGIDVRWIDLFVLKPFPSEKLAMLLEGIDRVVIIEEQSSFGGLGAQVCEWMVEKGRMLRLHRIHLPDTPCYHYGSREWLHDQLGMSVEHVKAAVHEQVNALIAECVTDTL